MFFLNRRRNQRDFIIFYRSFNLYKVPLHVAKVAIANSIQVVVRVLVQCNITCNDYYYTLSMNLHKSKSDEHICTGLDKIIFKQ